MGRTYARALVNSGRLDVPLTWLDHEFAINAASRVIVCPYFDYRQLSNLKIDRLAALSAIPLITIKTNNKSCGRLSQ